MRTHNYNNITVTYPDEYCYVFNPINIEISGLSDSAKITISVDGITLVASAFNGKAIFNIAPIIQSFFDVKQLSIIDLSKSVSESKTAKNISVVAADANLTFTTLCIWGALQTDLGILLSGDFNYDYSSDFLKGALKGDVQDVIWFGDLPFSISVPMLAGDTIVINGMTIHTALKHSVINVSLNKVFVDLNLIGNINMLLKEGNDIKRTYRIIRHDVPKSCMYMRWIDKKGYYNYWAFEKGSDEFESDKYGVYISTYQRSVDYTNGFNNGDGRQQGKTSKRNINIASPLVNMSIWNYLLGVTQSPIVDLYTNNDYLDSPRYIKVDVATGKQSRGSTELADFVAAITLPQINNQRL